MVLVCYFGGAIFMQAREYDQSMKVLTDPKARSQIRMVTFSGLILLAVCLGCALRLNR